MFEGSKLYGFDLDLRWRDCSRHELRRARIGGQMNGWTDGRREGRTDNHTCRLVLKGAEEEAMGLQGCRGGDF